MDSEFGSTRCFLLRTISGGIDASTRLAERQIYKLQRRILMPLQLPHLSLAKIKTLCETTKFIVQESLKPASLKPAASTTTGKIRFFSEESSGSVPSQL
ncbi:unnamed protein product, partial [Musa acuminata var. zebrina]